LGVWSVSMGVGAPGSNSMGTGAEPARRSGLVRQGEMQEQGSDMAAGRGSMATREGLGVNASGRSVETVGATTRKQDGCAGQRRSKPHPGPAGCHIAGRTLPPWRPARRTAPARQAAASLIELQRGTRVTPNSMGAERRRSRGQTQQNASHTSHTHTSEALDPPTQVSQGNRTTDNHGQPQTTLAE
jgi:hypothetical protein